MTQRKAQNGRTNVIPELATGTQQLVVESSFEQAAIQVRDTLLKGLHTMNEIAKRYEYSRATKCIQPIVETLEELQGRIVQSQLPAPVVRLILNDARLDAIIVYSDLRVSLMYDHQELIAPSEKLRNQFHEFRAQAEYASTGWIETSGLDLQRALAKVDEDLKYLEEANRLIRLQSIPAGENKLNEQQRKFTDS